MEGKAQETNQWFRELRRTLDSTLRDKIACCYEHLAKKIAKRYIQSGEPIEDLIGEGYVGLMKAIDRFDPDQGVEFSTYATHTINGEIRHHLRDRSKSITEPNWHHQLRIKILNNIESLQIAQGHWSLQEVADRLETEPDKVAAVLRAGQLLEVDSLEDRAAKDDGTAISSWEELTSDQQADFTKSVATQLEVRQALQRLNSLQQRVIFQCFYQGCTKTEVACELGLSNNYVGYLFKKGMNNLRELLSELAID